jgi:hypothetical protein
MIRVLYSKRAMFELGRVSVACCPLVELRKGTPFFIITSLEERDKRRYPKWTGTKQRQKANPTRRYHDKTMKWR